MERDLEEIVNKKVRELRKIGAKVTELKEGNKIKLAKGNKDALKESPLGRKIKQSLAILNERLT